MFTAVAAFAVTLAGAPACVENVHDVGPAVFEVAGDAGLPFVDSGGSTLCSAATATTPVTVTFENHSPTITADLLWVDPQCAETLYTTMPPQTGYHQPTYAGHVWRLRDHATSALLLEVQIDASKTTVSYP